MLQNYLWKFIVFVKQSSLDFRKRPTECTDWLMSDKITPLVGRLSVGILLFEVSFSKWIGAHRDFSSQKTHRDKCSGYLDKPLLLSIDKSHQYWHTSVREGFPSTGRPLYESRSTYRRAAYKDVNEFLTFTEWLFFK